MTGLALIRELRSLSIQPEFDGAIVHLRGVKSESEVPASLLRMVVANAAEIARWLLAEAAGRDALLAELREWATVIEAARPAVTDGASAICFEAALDWWAEMDTMLRELHEWQGCIFGPDGTCSPGAVAQCQACLVVHSFTDPETGEQVHVL